MKRNRDDDELGDEPVKKTKKAKRPKDSDLFSKVVFMTLEKETKGALRYQEIDNEGQGVAEDEDGKVLGTLYIRKSAFPEGSEAPDEIVLTIRDRRLVE